MKVKSTEADTALGGVTTGADDATIARVASPLSTGGAGTTFEQHVGAYWLAQLLVGAIPPILIDTTVSEVSFQTSTSAGRRMISSSSACERAGLPSGSRAR
jgi:hypothetical protein